MCGFCGVVSTTPGARVGTELVGRMTDVLRHRGPDDRGVEAVSDGVVLGFRRLAILDLSAAGHQPMTSPGGRYTAVFNGEIYNYRELSRSLGCDASDFRGGSDTEVLLTAFERWGVRGTLPRLVGMFAIAVWDAAERRLHLVRDRLGIKPLYYASGGFGLAFASELKALVSSSLVSGEVDPDAFAAYSRLLYVPAPATILRGVRKVRPGEIVTVDPERPADPVADRYWSLADIAARGVRSRSGLDLVDAADGLEALLADAVRLRLVADVPLGALLSGGIDSTVVVALAQEASGGRLRTFSVGFDRPEHDESDHARAIARHLGTDHTELPVSAADALGIVEELPWLCDEPLGNPSIIPTFQISALARRSVTVALTGDGGDELFAGYNRHLHGARVLNRLSRVPALGRRGLHSVGRLFGPRVLAAGYGAALRWLPGARRERLVAEKLQKLLGLLRAGDAQSMYLQLFSPWRETRPPTAIDWTGEELRNLWRDCGDWPLLDRMLLFDQTSYLPDDLLAKVDRASMAASLEARVPILDHRIVEYAWTLEPELKLGAGQTKRVLREVLYRRVPRELVDRPKTGFTVPIGDWLRGPLRDWGHTVVSELPDDGLLDLGAVRRSWNAFLSGRSAESLGLWTVIVYGAWRKRWLD